MEKYIIIVLLFFFNPVIGQKIKVVDSQNDPIYNVGFFKKDQTKAKFSNFKGEVDLSEFNDNDTIIVQHPTFENKNIEEIIENNQNGFIFHDFKDLPNLLNKIINNKELFELISKNARETINQNYIFESAITREVDIYKSLLQNI